jgi:hypothetical protein
MYSTDTFELPLRVHIISKGESIEINIHSINISLDTNGSPYEKFIPWEEPKWIQFCKEHKFHPIKDYDTKIYRLYLDMCTEGLIK